MVLSKAEGIEREKGEACQTMLAGDGQRPFRCGITQRGGGERYQLVWKGRIQDEDTGGMKKLIVFLLLTVRVLLWLCLLFVVFCVVDMCIRI